MSIELVNVTKHYRTLNGLHTVYRDFSLTIPKGKSIGVIGHNGAGKSTLLKLICGSELPDSGYIERNNMSISWPLASTGFFAPDMTGAENATFCARLYNREPREVVEFVKAYAGLGKFIDWPVKGYSSGMRGKLGFALSLAIRFDCILIDEVLAAGDANFRERAAMALESIRARCSFLMVSHDLKSIIRMCDQVIVLGGPKPVVTDDVRGAVKTFYYEMLARNGPPEAHKEFSRA